MIPAVWYSLFGDVDGRAQWDGGRGVVSDLVSARCGPIPDLVQMDNTDQRFAARNDRTVVLLPGQHHADARSVEWLCEDLARSERVVLIVHGDEASLFPWQQVEHPDLTLWVMTPRWSVHGSCPDGTRFIGEGAGPPVALPAGVKDVDVAFLGQSTHVRRQQLVAVLAQMDPQRTVCEPTPGFLLGRPRSGYMAQMGRAKVAPCPAGVESVDSFRLYEAIGAGCVPVVERHDRRGVDEGMWDLCYPGGVPFPVVSDWGELPGLLPDLLAGHAELSAECREWWSGRRRAMAADLTADLTRP